MTDYPRRGRRRRKKRIEDPKTPSEIIQWRLQQAVDDGEYTRYRLSQLTGIHQTVIGDYWTGDRPVVSANHLDILSELFGYQLKESEEAD